MHPVASSPLRRRATRLGVAVAGAVLATLLRAEAVLASPDGEQTVSDPERTRVITIAIVAMVVAGVVVLAVTVWFWRSTRPEPSALAPLEVMGQRSFVRADHDEQQRQLERVRPPGDEADAEPVEPVVEPVVEPEQVAVPVAAADPVAADEPAEQIVPAADAAGADATVEAHEDHTPEGEQRPSTDGDEAAKPPAIDPLLGRFQ